MTDQKFKLVPVVPTEKMLHAALSAFCLPATATMAAAIRASIAAAPKPVCRWASVGIGFDTRCGKHVEPDHSFNKPYPFCPHCGKRVVVVVLDG